MPGALERRFIELGDPPLTSNLKPYFDQVVRRRRELVPPLSALRRSIRHAAGSVPSPSRSSTVP